jgi:hypothetical protein
MAFNLFEAPEYYQGLLGEDATKKLQNRALTTGLVNAAIGYLAQPKTGGYGSALPYLGRALAGGLQAGQETIRSGLTDYETQQKLAEMKRKQEQQQALQGMISGIQDPNEKLYAQLAPEQYVAAKVKPQTKSFNILNDEQAKAYGLPTDRGQKYQLTESGAQLIGGTEQKDSGLTELDKLIRSRDDLRAKDPTNPNIAVYDDAIKKASTFAPPSQTNVNVSTKGEGKFQETLGTELAKKTVGVIDAGQAAPDQIASARRIKTVLQGQTFTGAGAEQILGINNALAAAGVIDPKTGINTEMLMADMAKTTLQNIKSSGLGAGQGFSNADRDFLEKASAGKITLNAGTIKYIADLNERAGLKAIDKYNTTIKSLPAENRQYYNLEEINTEQYRPKGRLR